MTKVTIKKAKKTKGVEYKFSTDDGFLSVGPEDIVDALKDLSEHQERRGEYSRSNNPDEFGWSVIHGKDQNGKMRPLFLMRSLPSCVPMPCGQYAQDDEKMAELVVKKVYHLNIIKIKWIRFKLWVSQRLADILPKKKGTK